MERPCGVPLVFGKPRHGDELIVDDTELDPSRLWPDHDRLAPSGDVEQLPHIVAIRRFDSALRDDCAISPGKQAVDGVWILPAREDLEPLSSPAIQIVHNVSAVVQGSSQHHPGVGWKRSGRLRNRQGAVQEIVVQADVPFGVRRRVLLVTQPSEGTLRVSPEINRVEGRQPTQQFVFRDPAVVAELGKLGPNTTLRVGRDTERDPKTIAEWQEIELLVAKNIVRDRRNHVGTLDIYGGSRPRLHDGVCPGPHDHRWCRVFGRSFLLDRRPRRRTGTTEQEEGDQKEPTAHDDLKDTSAMGHAATRRLLPQRRRRIRVVRPRSPVRDASTWPGRCTTSSGLPRKPTAMRGEAVRHRRGKRIPTSPRTAPCQTAATATGSTSTRPEIE